MKGKITRIWRNETGDGQRYCVLEIDGQKYSLWDEKYFDKLREGLEVDYEWKKSGRFKKITDIKILEPQTCRDRCIKIIRMSCLKSASEILYGLEGDPYKKADLAVEIAKRFEKYVLDGEVPGDYRNSERQNT